ncbi:BLUF domain-containing protein [Paracoccus aerius]|uniref:BLUF domain-containing protein n=1 Tax=Paracoccus aerius TaxID=1915382 RepID=A0ABS1S9N9_9RHOB|nr:BLUF domain-containing protein [Paracoccus aerius]
MLATSRRKNTAAGLTGFLHRESDIYYQWLEGPEDEVMADLQPHQCR